MRLNAERLSSSTNQWITKFSCVTEAAAATGLHCKLCYWWVLLCLVFASMENYLWAVPVNAGLSGTTTATEKVSRWTVRFRFCLHHRVLPQFQPPSTRGTYRSKPDCGPRIRPESELTSLFPPTSWQLWVTMLLRWGFLKPSPDTYSLAPDHRATSRLKIRGCGGFAWGILSVVQVSLRLKNWICRRNHSFGDPENWVRDSCHLSNEGLSLSAMRWTCIQWGTSSQCRA